MQIFLAIEHVNIIISIELKHCKIVYKKWKTFCTCLSVIGKCIITNINKQNYIHKMLKNKVNMKLETKNNL